MSTSESAEPDASASIDNQTMIQNIRLMKRHSAQGRATTLQKLKPLTVTTANDSTLLTARLVPYQAPPPPMQPPRPADIPVHQESLAPLDPTLTTVAAAAAPHAVQTLPPAGWLMAVQKLELMQWYTIGCILMLWLIDRWILYTLYLSAIAKSATGASSSPPPTTSHGIFVRI
jgi:hypothetical protein